jgi:DNA-binding transcriptional LysR family regulator
MPREPSSRRIPYKVLGLPQLRSFAVVCRLGGYAAAARELLLTTPAVWEQIQSLERHFGCELLERDGNRVRPNLRGSHLLELIQPVLAGLDSVADVLHQRDNVLPHRLTVISNLRVLVDEISSALFQFRQRYPTVTLGVSYVGSDLVQPLVLDARADIALTLEPAPDEHLSSSLSYEPAGELGYWLVTPPRHALLRKKALRLESIVEYPLVLGEAQAYSRHRVQEVFHRHKLLERMQLAVETSSDEYTLACVRANLGVGIAVGNPDSTLYRGLGTRTLRRWFGTARIGFLWRRGAHVPPLQRELAELLRRTITAGR